MRLHTNTQSLSKTPKIHLLGSISKSKSENPNKANFTRYFTVAIALKCLVPVKVIFMQTILEKTATIFVNSTHVVTLQLHRYQLYHLRV